MSINQNMYESHKEIEAMQAEDRIRQEETLIKEAWHPDRRTIEHFSPEELAVLERQIKANIEDLNRQPSLHPDRRNIEQFSAEELRALEAQVRERREFDRPYKEYFQKLIKDPNITSDEEFTAAVLRSAESNGLIEDFMTDLHSAVNSQLNQLKTVDRTDASTIEAKKTELEKYVALYVRYLYKLNDLHWDFRTMGAGNLNTIKFPEATLNDLWGVQKDLNITLKMPIPANLGEDYGNAFTREGKMMPGIRLVYEELGGQEVNWHQVLIYKEGELTPYQRFQQRQAQQRQLEEARRQDLSKMISQLDGAKDNNVTRGTK